MDMELDSPEGEVASAPESPSQDAGTTDPAEVTSSDKQLAEIDFATFPVSQADYEAACRVLRVFGRAEQDGLYESPSCRPLRALLQPLFDRQRRKMFAGKTPEELASRKQKKIKRAQELERQRREDQQFLQRTVLRAGRMRKLEEIAARQGEGGAVPLILDGAVDDGFNDAVTLSAEDSLRKAASTAIMGSSAAAVEDPSEEAAAARLNTSRGCYICKRRYQVLHHFYDTLCESCASLNWAKRMQTCDLSGRVCLVTGARVKIGFQSALKLLRCGAVVIATSRFPGDTALRYAMQTDYKEWSSRLHVFGVDLRDLAAIEELCAYLNSNFPWLDCIINNACQTIRRPPAYYADVIETERKVAAMCREEALRSEESGAAEDISYATSLTNHWKYQAACEASARALGAATGPSIGAKALEGPTADREGGGGAGAAFASSVDRSAIVTVAADRELPSELFPEQRRDVNSQQLDLRRSNSWLLTLSSGQISTPELAEVFAINAMAPFILASKLTPLLTAPRPARPDAAAATGVPTSLSIPRELAAVAASEATYQQSLAETVLRDLAAEAPSDARRAKRQRDAWKGGGDISGHFTPADAPAEPVQQGADAGSGGPELVPAAECRFIVNVSSMEGKFYRRKLATHPHTNMAKAALNMLTRTSAAEYEKHSIYMTAVDTGWINDENPIERAAKTAERHNFATPLDEIDAAARILDPMLGPLRAAEDRAAAGGGPHAALCSPPFGCFLKDYFPTEW